MVKCQVCGKELNLPFVCKYCGGFFCVDHRLPENHACKMLEEIRKPTILRPKPTSIPTSKIKKIVYVGHSKAKPKISTSFHELRDLGIALTVLILVGLAWLRFFQFFYPQIFLIVLAGVIPAFLLHEFAHKITAQKYGAWAEFRLDPFGLMITALSIILPIKIIAPGAVVIFGHNLTMEHIGRISLAGPLTNLILALIFISLPIQNPIFSFIIIFNLIIAVFNLLPFSVLDGRKIFIWNKLVWAIIFALTVFLYITYVYIL